jgi:hypothetical protein
MGAHGFRDLGLEKEVLDLTREFGIGAQFGGRYFCHDVRVIRLPRHGASCPVAIAVSCSADRQALGKITTNGVWLERLETEVEVLEYPELGMEAVWRIEVVDFPAFVVVDDKGNDFFAETGHPVLTIGRR